MKNSNIVNRLADGRGTVSRRLKKIFVQDSGIPITVLEEPYFSSRLELFDSVFRSTDRYNTFLEELENGGYESEEDYVKYRDDLIQHIVSDIKHSPSYEEFSALQLSKKSDKRTQVIEKSVYSYIKENGYRENRFFASIKMEDSLFKTMNHFSHQIFGEKKSFVKYMKQYTNLYHLIHSENLRERIFFELNKEHIEEYREILMLRLLNGITTKYGKTKNHPVSPAVEFKKHILDQDTIYLECKTLNQAQNLRREIERKLSDVYENDPVLTDLNFNTDVIQIFPINGIQGYTRVSYDKNDSMSLTYKEIDPSIFPIMLRIFNRESIREEDRIFEVDNILCRIQRYPLISF